MLLLLLLLFLLLLFLICFLCILTFCIFFDSGCGGEGRGWRAEGGGGSSRGRRESGGGGGLSLREKLILIEKRESERETKENELDRDKGEKKRRLTEKLEMRDR